MLQLSEMTDSRREAVLEHLDDDARARALELLANLGDEGAPTIPEWLAARASPAGAPAATRITDAARDELRRRIAEMGAIPALEAARPGRSLAGRLLGLLA